MRSHQQQLIQLITRESLNTDEDIFSVFKSLDMQGLANIFIDATFLLNVFQFIQEQYLSEKKDKYDEIIFSNFVKKFLTVEFAPVLFFHSSLANLSIEKIDLFKKNVEIIQKLVINYAKNLVFPENKAFATNVMKLMSELFEFEYQLTMTKKSKGQYLGYSLYRSFDIIDDFFNLNYNVDLTLLNQNPNNERLYEGSGVTVQSSYTTILLALRYLRIPTGSRFIDLGSGFGRVGLVIGLLRPDISFRGYEFAQHRVDVATQASQLLGMDSHVKYITQDLASKDFLIPEAETYYLFDPFTEETYEHVLSQLSLIKNRIKLTVITKGNAKQYFLNSKTNGLWSRPQEFEHGNFCLFRS